MKDFHYNSANFPQHNVCQLSPVPSGIAPQHLAVFLTLEVQLYEALPGVSYATVELYRSAAGERRCFTGGSLCHVGVFDCALRFVIDRAGGVIDKGFCLVYLYHYVD